MPLRLRPSDGHSLIIALALAANDLTAANAGCTNDQPYPCQQCAQRADLIATCDRLIVQLDDHLAQLARLSRRAARTPEAERSPRGAAPQSAKRQPAGTVLRLPSRTVTVSEPDVTT